MHAEVAAFKAPSLLSAAAATAVAGTAATASAAAAAAAVAAVAAMVQAKPMAGKDEGPGPNGAAPAAVEALSAALEPSSSAAIVLAFGGIALGKH